uniref:RING-type domain-containing protein n=1 Tax=Lotharella globosa TaxID=91324 RepID=A0A7S3Z2S4_9EUKA
MLEKMLDMQGKVGCQGRLLVGRYAGRRVKILRVHPDGNTLKWEVRPVDKKAPSRSVSADDKSSEPSRGEWKGGEGDREVDAKGDSKKSSREELEEEESFLVKPENLFFAASRADNSEPDGAGKSELKEVGCFEQMKYGSIKMCVELDKDHLQCCVCYDALVGKIFQCQLGAHNICESCKLKINQTQKSGVCPIDRVAGGFVRNLLLEKQVHSITTACVNAHRGCSVRTFPWLVEAHMAECVRFWEQVDVFHCPVCYTELKMNRSRFPEHLASGECVSTFKNLHVEKSVLAAPSGTSTAGGRDHVLATKGFSWRASVTVPSIGSSFLTAEDADGGAFALILWRPPYTDPVDTKEGPPQQPQPLSPPQEEPREEPPSPQPEAPARVENASRPEEGEEEEEEGGEEDEKKAAGDDALLPDECEDLRVIVFPIGPTAYERKTAQTALRESKAEDIRWGGAKWQDKVWSGESLISQYLFIGTEGSRNEIKMNVPFVFDPETKDGTNAWISMGADMRVPGPGDVEEDGIKLHLKLKQVYERLGTGLGGFIDALDTVQKWHVAKIIKRDEESVLIHYTGFEAKWDEWVPLTSDRLSPLGIHEHMTRSSLVVLPHS